MNKVIQISSSQDECSEITLFALDSEGNIWERFVFDGNTSWTKIDPIPLIFNDKEV
jgi:hypothetical protein